MNYGHHVSRCINSSWNGVYMQINNKAQNNGAALSLSPSTKCCRTNKQPLEIWMF